MALKVTSKTTKSELEAEVLRLHREQKDYKERVARVALEHRDNEGWCSEGFREAMDELELLEFVPSSERLVVLKVIVDADSAGLDAAEADDDEWAEAAIYKLRYASVGDLEGYAVEDVPKDN